MNRYDFPESPIPEGQSGKRPSAHVEGENLPSDDHEKKADALPLTPQAGRLEYDGKRAVLMDVAGGLYSLKKSLRADIGFFEKDFMFRAGQDGAREFLSSLGKAAIPVDPAEAAGIMLEMYTLRGFGMLKLESIEPDSMTARISTRNSMEAWAFQENKDLQRESVCAYTAGVLTWICSLALSRETPLDIELGAYEEECVAQGGTICRCVIAPEKELARMFPGYQKPNVSISEHALNLNEEILVKNLELQGLNLALERQIRKRTEDLWKSEENYKSLMRMSPEPIAVILLDSRIHSANQAGLKVLGLESIDDIQKANLSSYLTDSKKSWDKIIWMLEKEGAVSGLELELTRPDGSKAIGLLHARFADLMPGKCVEVVLKDITEKRQMEQTVKDAQTELEFLNDLMSHDIMNYTFSALHFLNSLWKSKLATEEDRHALTLVTKDVQGAFELCSSVRDLSRIKSLEDDDLLVKDLNMFIRESIEESKRMFSDRKVNVDFGGVQTPHYTKCSTLATRLFTNLLTNAIKYDPHEEARIDVSVSQTAEGGVQYWRIEVVDNGKGIPDDEKERVFQRFHRIDLSVSGTGLGLFVVRFIAKASGGKVWAEDRVQGDHTKGTKMVVLLPKADERLIAKAVTRSQTGT